MLNVLNRTVLFSVIWWGEGGVKRDFGVLTEDCERYGEGDWAVHRRGRLSRG